MKPEIVPRHPLTTEEAAALFPGLHPVLARAYAARRLTSPGELEYGLANLAPHDRLKGIREAARLLGDMIRKARRMLVIADFDADGATSCALAVRALRMMGGHVSYRVPNRFAYGYGLTPEIVAAVEDEEPDLIITVDNGISSIEGVRAARVRGIQVLVTDHHLPGAELPEADVIVNPNQPGDGFPSKSMAGVGVIFYVMIALRAHLRGQGWFAERGLPDPNLASLLDLVALGTVADVVRLDYNNRILVAQGLSRIRGDACCTGIRALIRVAGRNQQRLVSADLGFALGPRLNAAGRLEDMSLGVECLLCDDEEQALEMALYLDELNRERRRIEKKMQQEALQCLDHLDFDDVAARGPAGVCLYREDWHQGVIGILASRIKDRLHRPVIAFAPAGGDELKGSARSVTGLNIRDVLEGVASRHPGLMNKFGGHAMAAGLSLPEAGYETFVQAFDEVVREFLGEEGLENVVLSDGALRPDEFTLELAEALRGGGPWGQGFPEPLFDGVFHIVERRVVGGHHLKLRLTPDEAGTVIDAIAFNVEPHHPIHHAGSLHIAYRLDANEYQGRCMPQLVIEHILDQWGGPGAARATPR